MRFCARTLIPLILLHIRPNPRSSPSPLQASQFSLIEPIILWKHRPKPAQNQRDEENARNESSCNLRLDVSCSGVLSLTQHEMNSTIFSPQGHDWVLFFLPLENPKGGNSKRNFTKKGRMDGLWAVDKLSEWLSAGCVCSEKREKKSNDEKKVKGFLCLIRSSWVKGCKCCFTLWAVFQITLKNPCGHSNFPHIMKGLTSVFLFSFFVLAWTSFYILTFSLVI